MKFFNQALKITTLQNVLNKSFSKLTNNGQSRRVIRGRKVELSFKLTSL